MNANEQDNQQIPEGWHPDMRPVETQPHKVPVLDVDDSSGEVKVEVIEEEQEGREYWKKRFEDVNKENQVYAPYRDIMEHLKTNGDLVDVLQQHINGDFVEAQKANNTIMEDEEDEYGNPIQKQEPASQNQNVKTTDEQLANAKESGRQNAIAQIELKQFLDNLMSTGVPDHIADKFVETINNPTGFNIADLYAAFMNKETRDTTVTEKQPVTEKTGPLGSPLSASGGATDKPTGDQFKETKHDGYNYVANPNAI